MLPNRPSNTAIRSTIQFNASDKNFKHVNAGYKHKAKAALISLKLNKISL